MKQKFILQNSLSQNSKPSNQRTSVKEEDIRVPFLSLRFSAWTTLNWPSSSCTAFRRAFLFASDFKNLVFNCSKIHHKKKNAKSKQKIKPSNDTNNKKEDQNFIQRIRKLHRRSKASTDLNRRRRAPPPFTSETAG